MKIQKVRLIAQNGIEERVEEQRLLDESKVFGELRLYLYKR